MPDRPRLSLALAVTLAVLGSALAVAPASAGSAQKVAIIVGPTGSQTDGYRSTGDQIAASAAATGARVVKVYSPNATWANVRAAVAGANVIVYLGHGNGFPNPYSSTEWTDRVNGWGLNMTTGNGDRDQLNTTMVYCGEKALLGTLTSSDGSTQWNYCGGKTNTDGIAPAANFVMVYSNACYAPGAGEVRPAPAESVALERVKNFSTPILRLGGTYFATDLGSKRLVELILGSPDVAFGEIFRQGSGYDPTALRIHAHADVAGSEVWVQKTTSQWLGTDYWYAFAGDPTRTPAGGVGALPDAPSVTKVAPADGKKWVRTSARVKAWFDAAVVGVSGSTFTLHDAYGFRVEARVRWRADLNRAVLVPALPLIPKERYMARLSGAIRNGEGVPLVPVQWSFRVRADGGDGSAVNWPKTERLTFKHGTHTAYTLNQYGRPVQAKTATLSADSGASTTTLRTLRGQSGSWFYVSNGLWAGHWIRQSEVVHLADAGAPAASAPATYEPSARLDFAEGTHTGYQFDASGRMTAQKTYTLSSASGANASALQAIPNQSGTWFQVVNGVWSGYWIRASDVVSLAAGG